MITVNEQTFEDAVRNSKNPVLVVFVTEWSVISAALVKRASELDPSKWTVLRVDVDKAPKLGLRFSIRQIPHILRFTPTGELVASSRTLDKSILENV